MTPRFALDRPRRVHLVGIGGAGMSAIARVLLQRGHLITGSDLHDSRTLDALRAMGAEVRVGHEADAIAGAEVVVTSTAVPARNPEIVAAHDAGIEVLPRAEMLAAIMDGHRNLLVAGTHGKTTTTSMTVVALQAGGRDPGFAIGAALNETGSNAHAGSGPYFVAEADESDRSFLTFDSEAVIITNVELDHPDEFADEREVADAFVEFAARRTGPAIVCVDDPGAAAVADRLTGEVLRYGEHAAADIRLTATVGAPRVTAGDEEVTLDLAVPGRHNLLNATAALAACRWADVPLDVAAAGLTRFRGAQRRYQHLGSAGGVVVVDDYAHHPTELRATLAAARTTAAGRVVVVVQPHRYSRTERFGAELGRAAAGADVVIVTEVYASGEDPMPGVSGMTVADAARDAGATVLWEPHLGAVAERLLEVVRPDDLVLVTGAGDVTSVGPALLGLLRGRS